MTDILERLIAQDESARSDLFACAANEIMRLRAALQVISNIENRTDGGDWDEIDDARLIARDALCLS